MGEEQKNLLITKFGLEKLIALGSTDRDMDEFLRSTLEVITDVVTPLISNVQPEEPVGIEQPSPEMFQDQQEVKNVTSYKMEDFK